MAVYSAFFSSGLLAPHYASLNTYTSEPFTYKDPTPSSPLPIPDDSDIEVDTEREETPTPDVPTPPVRTTISNAQARPRLRKRRSSITVGTSPMNSIRSPTRTAGAALQLQLHLPPTSPSRSRSGSLSTEVYGGAGILGNVATESTSLVGRMRSGSVGAILRPRRAVRRLASVPAPAPPPTVPLPAIPSWGLAPPPQMKFTPLSVPLCAAFPHQGMHVKMNSSANVGPGTQRPPLTTRRSSSDVVPMMKGRDRSFSVGAGCRIDEEMKEN